MENGNYINNTKICNLIRNGKLKGDGKPWGIKVQGGSEDEILTYCYYTQDLNNFDLDVADAIYTIFNNRKRDLQQKKTPAEMDGVNLEEIADTFIITPSNILRCLSGKKTQVCSKKTEALIIASVDKLAETRIFVNCKKEMTRHKKDNDQDALFAGFEEQPFLHAEKKEKGNRWIYVVPSQDVLNPETRYAEYAGDAKTEYFMPLYYYAQRNGHFLYFSNWYLIPDEEKFKAYENDNANLVTDWENAHPTDAADVEEPGEETEEDLADRGRVEILEKRNEVFEEMEKLNNSIEHIQLKRYLIRKIHPYKNHMVHAGKESMEQFRYMPSNNINFDDLLNVISVKRDDYTTNNSGEIWKKRIKDICQNVCTILDYYTVIHYIKSYNFTEFTRRFTFYADSFDDSKPVTSQPKN